MARPLPSSRRMRPISFPTSTNPLQQKSPRKITSKVPISERQQVAARLNPAHCWGAVWAIFHLLACGRVSFPNNSGSGNGRLQRRQHVMKYSLRYQFFNVSHRQREQRLRSHQHTLSLICSCLFWLLLSCNISWIGKFLKSLLFSCSFHSILFYFSVHSSYLSPLFDNHTFPNHN